MNDLDKLMQLDPIGLTSTQLSQVYDHVYVMDPISPSISRSRYTEIITEYMRRMRAGGKKPKREEGPRPPPPASLGLKPVKVVLKRRGGL